MSRSAASPSLESATQDGSGQRQRQQQRQWLRIARVCACPLVSPARLCLVCSPVHSSTSVLRRQVRRVLMQDAAPRHEPDGERGLGLGSGGELLVARRLIPSQVRVLLARCARESHHAAGLALRLCRSHHGALSSSGCSGSGKRSHAGEQKQWRRGLPVAGWWHHEFRRGRSWEDGRTARIGNGGQCEDGYGARRTMISWFLLGSVRRRDRPMGSPSAKAPQNIASLCNHTSVKPPSPSNWQAHTQIA